MPDKPAKRRMDSMRAALVAGFLVLQMSTTFGQSAGRPLAFDVASVKTSQRIVGPDGNHRVAFEPSGITARNVTLRRLVAEAYHLQLQQVLGPRWLDENEYELEAKTSGPVARERLALMLQTLLTERFRLTQHHEIRELRVYELLTDKTVLKIHPVEGGGAPSVVPGLHFRGDMRQFADLLAVQLTIPVSDDPGRPGRAGGPPVPVLDKTGLGGIYDFSLQSRDQAGSRR